MDEKTALLFAKTKEFQYIVNKTEGFIKWALAQVKNPYVACSFGKDSAVMLHLILKQKPDIQVIFIELEYSNLLNNYDEIIDKWGNINLIRLNFGLGLGNHKEIKEIDKMGFDSAFIGLRQDESTQRRIALKRFGKFYTRKNGIVRIAPLSEWNLKHIEAYIYSNKLPTLMTYLKNGLKTRTTAGVTDIARERMLSELKKADLNRYNSLLNHLPYLKDYV